MDLQALGQSSLPGIEIGGATLQHSHIQGIAPSHVLSCFLQLDLAGGNFFRSSLLPELRDQYAVIELSHLESDLILRLIHLNSGGVEIGGCGAIGGANLEHLGEGLFQTGTAGVGRE